MRRRIPKDSFLDKEERLLVLAPQNLDQAFGYRQCVGHYSSQLGLTYESPKLVATTRSTTASVQGLFVNASHEID